MTHPTSPTTHGFEALDLSSLARVTSKAFERLLPYTLIQDPSSPEARPTINKIINKIQAYVEAIDMSIHVVHITYQMSKIAVALWTNPATSNEKQILVERTRRQKQLEYLVILADEAQKKAQKTTTVFEQVQQEFYKIAASTKNMDCTVQIPVDPTLRKLIYEDTAYVNKINNFPVEVIKKPLKDIGPDLVSNLNLLADFTRHSSDLTLWCGWINSGIITTDGTVVPPQDGSLTDADTIRPKWNRVHADCLIYHSIVRFPVIHGRPPQIHASHILGCLVCHDA
ncbi:hypothetical protein C0995_010956 [Termitomyces sp. Mi166|nr:hypothetical protein C0995_010956 [Termitomyces sp. Mi166\